MTERLDAVLLEKAETEQHCVSLKKDNIKMKQEVEVRQDFFYLSIFINLYNIVVNFRTRILKSISLDFPDGSVVKNLRASAGDTSSVPDPGRSHMPQSS